MPFDRRTMLKAGLGLAALGSAPRARAAADDALVAAAKKEGQINCIAMPRDWANWGAIMDSFQAKYGLKLDSANPDGSSAEELQAIRSLRSQARAPDVVDVGPAFAATGAQQKLFQPYKVSTWADIPDEVKHADGAWTGDYFGVAAFAANTQVSKTVPESWDDLKKPEYKGMVALNGSPLGAAAAFGAVFAAALGNGGSYDDIGPGVEFFGDLARRGNLNPAAATPASLVSGQTPVVVNWDYLSLGYRKQNEGKADIQVRVPRDAPPFGTFYCMAISAYAPHPETAKLWMEHVYSDEGQLAFLGGFAHPIRFNAMVAAGKVPDSALHNLPPAEAYQKVRFATAEQTAKAQKTLADMWPRVVKI